MFLLLVFLVLIYSFFIFKDTKDITFFNSHNRTDNEKMLRAAYLYSESGLFKWPGSVHSINDGKGRAELREFWLIFIAFIQKFFPSERKYTEHVNITAGIVSHAISTLVIFTLSKYFLPDYIALLISTIYLTSLGTFLNMIDFCLMVGSLT